MKWTDIYRKVIIDWYLLDIITKYYVKLFNDYSCEVIALWSKYCARYLHDTGNDEGIRNYSIKMLFGSI